MSINEEWCYIALRKFFHRRVKCPVKPLEICQWHCLATRIDLFLQTEYLFQKYSHISVFWNFSILILAFSGKQSLRVDIFNYYKSVQHEERKKDKIVKRAKQSRRCVSDRNPFEWFTRPLQEHDGVNLSHEKRQMFYSHKASSKRRDFSVASTYV